MTGRELRERDRPPLALVLGAAVAFGIAGWLAVSTAAGLFATVEVLPVVGQAVSVLIASAIVIVAGAVTFLFATVDAPILLRTGESAVMAGLDVILLAMIVSLLGTGWDGRTTVLAPSALLELALVLIGAGIATGGTWLARDTAGMALAVRATLMLGAVAGMGLALAAGASLVGLTA